MVLGNTHNLTPSCTTFITLYNSTQSTGTLTINAPAGSPVDGQQMAIRITCANDQAPAWNAIYREPDFIPGALLTTLASGTLLVLYMDIVNQR